MSKAQGQLIGQAYGRASPADFDAAAAIKSAPEGAAVDLDQFMPIQHGKLTHKFWLYLKNRGFDDPDAVIQQYNLKACLSGRWSGRLIIPANHVGWQGRALRTTKDTPRYLTSHEDVKKTLFNMVEDLDRPRSRSGYRLVSPQAAVAGHDQILYVCEGPIDAIKVDFYGQQHGARATCLFGATPTIEQIHLLSSISNNFSRVILLLDNDTAGQAASFQLTDWVRNIEIGALPDGVKDPGSMSGDQVRRMVDDKNCQPSVNEGQPYSARKTRRG